MCVHFVSFSQVKSKRLTAWIEWHLKHIYNEFDSWAQKQQPKKKNTADWSGERDLNKEGEQYRTEQYRTEQKKRATVLYNM